MAIVYCVCNPAAGTIPPSHIKWQKELQTGAAKTGIGVDNLLPTLNCQACCLVIPPVATGTGLCGVSATGFLLVFVATNSVYDKNLATVSGNGCLVLMPTGVNKSTS